ncbi:uncharacterized protein LOC134838508 [Culicoides brevitarsis]|uniref:uncharacterized protein LOC134838508 n=1 Tax=Culicoides brevitarsis TaxID=469753 RepID=UPI00307B5BE1
MSRNLAFKIPKECKHYEFKLVEELVLWPHPASAHYGQLSVIGFWDRDEDLLNSLSYEGSESLPDEKLSIPLMYQRNFNFPPRSTRVVEINGELKYRKVTDGQLVHSRHLMIQLQKLQMKLEKQHNLPKRRPTGLCDGSLHSSVKVSLLKMADYIKENYKPVILVHAMSQITQGDDLIQVNLKNRIIRKRLAES